MKLFTFIISSLFILCLAPAVLASDKSKDSDVLKLSLSSEPPTLDWNKANDSVSSRVLFNLMEGLVTHEYKDGEIKVVPALAKKWSSNKTSTVWTFELKEDCLWSDGQPLKAQHFVDSVERLLNPKTGSYYSYFLFPIKNAEKYSQGKLKNFSKVGVKAKGNTVVFTLHSPLAFFPNLLTHFVTFPVRKDLIAKHGTSWTKPKTLVSLGPYLLDSWKHDVELNLVKNEKSCVGMAKVPKVKFFIIPESTTGINLFESKSLDAFEGLPSTGVAIYKKRPEYHKQSTLSIYYIGFNTTKAPFDNPKVRKAFAHAVNNETIVKVLNGGQIAISGWLPPGVPGFNTTPRLPYNPELARKTLKEAGFTPENFPKITLAYNTNEDHKRVMELIQAQIKKNLGISLQIKNQEWKVYLSALKQDPPHMYRLGWYGDYPDPDNFYNLLTSYSNNNFTKWKNKSFDELIHKAAQTRETKDRLKLYDQIENMMLTENAVAIPIMSTVSHMLVSKRIKNYPANPMSRFVLKNTTKH